ncbi:MAG: ketol-acid reductoisomerase [Deltaproteobacteria bacterium CG11_big_fil_rev_8_21_14_0_20_45_16]|nr:MAG: ketol-acid reductoisomerase [Deltaproteobacteria bacterium CG11_big_fil_rev_8_21_14_0_20_45_16]
MALKDMEIGILGYGAQGRAEALNLKRSGIKFRLGLRKDGESWKKAQSEGFEPENFKKVIESSQVLMMNLPDQTQAEVYRNFIQGSAVEYLVFAHGFNTHFKLIPVENTGPEHILIAPKGAASGLISFYGTENALPAVLAFESAKQASIGPQEKSWVEDLALAIGANPKALFWARFKDETICDLFSEQALLCGGVSSLLRRTYEVLTEAGYNPETAYFETLFELKLIVDLIWKEGITGMRARISPTARYGDITRGDRIFDQDLKERMKQVLAEVENGKFAQEFLKESQSDQYKSLAKRQADHPIEVIGARLREKMHSS